MTSVSPIRGTPTQINYTPIEDGQILFEISNPNGQNHLYIDVDDERIPIGIYTWNQLSNRPFDIIGNGLTVTNDVLSANDQEWTQIRNKPFNTIGTGLSVVEGVLNANVISPRWSEIDEKPFLLIGTGLTVSDNILNANIRNVALSIEGTGSSTIPKYQQISVNTNGTTVNTEINGTKYMEYSQTLSTTNDTTYTFTNASITTDSAIDVFTSVWGIDPINVSISSGSCTVTFEAVDTAITMMCRIYIK